MDYPTLVAAGILLVTLSALYVSSTARYLSIREHESYRSFILREVDQLNHRILVLEQTRPTTGEIEARMNGTKFVHRES